MFHLTSGSSHLLSGSRRLRHFVTAQTSKHFDAAIVGAGPAGLTCASILLDHGLSRICMLDPSFTAGRINEKYRSVPSNTKTGKFVEWSTGTATFSQILDDAPRGNAFEKLRSLDQNEGCSLADAIDVAQLLSNGLQKDPRVTSIVSRVSGLVRTTGGTWVLPVEDVTAERVVLASGSHPKNNIMAKEHPHLIPLDVDTVLAPPSVLRKAVPAGSKVAVIGSSHTAVLALKNLYELGDVSIVNFYRSPLLYAVYKDGWILYDNTGLKGVAADWAKEVLAAEHLPPTLRRVSLKDSRRSEEEVYKAELGECTHVASAIGYQRNKLPMIGVDGSLAKPEFDPFNGSFYTDRKSSKHLEGLYGAGIAFPERVTDPEGNVESAVGWFKFMKFVKRVGPQWLEKRA